jgi:hypothetical protein
MKTLILASLLALTAVSGVVDASQSAQAGGGGRPGILPYQGR